MLAAAIAVGPAMGCGAAKLSNDPDKVYSSAVRLALADDHAQAARAAYHYMKSTTPDNARYDRAQKLLADSLDRMGLHYAASLFYLDIAQSRRDVRLVDGAIRALEAITERDGYDDNTVMRGFLASAEITGLAPKERAFVAYEQGLDSLKKGLMDWADARFAAIPKDSPYRLRAQYARAIQTLASYKLDETDKELRELLKADNLPDELGVKIHRTLARIAFEKKDYKGALAEYDKIRDTATDDPKLLLEMAWSHYYLGDYQRALGLLVALDAPAYRGLIAPERYLLEALALKQLCQFEPARMAAARLRARHGQAIADLYKGIPLENSKAIRRAARRRESGRQVAQFRRHMRHEAAIFDEKREAFGPELAHRLDQLYAHGLKEAKRREDDELYDEMRSVSEELLNAQEGVRLVLHELAVSVLRGRQREDKPPVRAQVNIPVGGDTVFYNFDGEFWTDEIDDLVVPLEDRCVE